MKKTILSNYASKTVTYFEYSNWNDQTITVRLLSIVPHTQTTVNTLVSCGKLKSSILNIFNIFYIYVVRFGPVVVMYHHHHHMVFLEWPKQQRHHEDHYSQSKYEQYQTVL